MPSHSRVAFQIGSSECYAAASIAFAHFIRSSSLPQSFGWRPAYLESSPFAFIPPTSTSRDAEVSLNATGESLDVEESFDQNSLEVRGDDLWSSHENVVSERASHPANSVQPSPRRSRYRGCYNQSWNGRNIRSREFWIEMRGLQVQWLEKVFTSPFQKSDATSYILECWEILTKVYSKLRGRPPQDMRQTIQWYVRATVKLTEFLIRRGCDEVSGPITNFVRSVLGRHLRNPKSMNESNPTWIESRRILLLVCQSLSTVGIAMAIVDAIDEMRISLLRKFTTTDVEKDIHFISYALKQMSDLVITANHRIINDC